jgi:putative lipoprotein
MLFITACSEHEEQAVQPMSEITGIIVPQHDITMSDGDTLKVSLLDISRADTKADVLAMQQLWGKNNWPIVYRLEYFDDQVKPGHRYAIQARLESASGQLLAITDEQHAVELSSLEAVSERNIVISGVDGTGVKQIPVRKFLCADNSFSVQFSQEYLVLREGQYGAAHILRRMKSASGAHYSSNEVDFWDKGGQAVITLQGKTFRPCVLHP